MRSVNEIRELLAEVSARDRPLRVFGAESHKYRTRPATAAELDALERRAGTALPDDYRRLLREVGAGAGPYYGLYSPEAAWVELDSLQPERDGVLAASPNRPFPITTPPAPGASSAPAPFPCDGALLIGEQGSGTQWSLLVISGPTAGTVWDVGHFEGSDGEYFGARRPPGVLGEGRPLPSLPSPPPLLDWYAGWLEQCLTDLVTPIRQP